jgi:YkoY family integral membrane protein
MWDQILLWIAPVLTLVVMEGLLSADNALVLAIMARKIQDPDKRKKALIYGMWGAVVFRAFFILIGVWLVKLWFIKVFGAIYLAKIAIDHFTKRDKEDEDADGMMDKYQSTWLHKLVKLVTRRELTVFWSVVVSIELMDVAFSADSILAALAISNSFWILLIGGVLGIAMMRGVAGVFLKLIERIPEMEHTAFILIAIIALKMGLSTVHNFTALFGHEMHEIHIGNGLFFGILVATFLATFIVHWFRKDKHSQNISA